MTAGMEGAVIALLFGIGQLTGALALYYRAKAQIQETRNTAEAAKQTAERSEAKTDALYNGTGQNLILDTLENHGLVERVTRKVEPDVPAVQEIGRKGGGAGGVSPFTAYSRGENYYRWIQ